MERPIPKRRLGRTELEVTILGLGGEGLLRSYGNDKEADELIKTALDLGINYMESARAYMASEIYYGRALKGRRSEVYLSTKSHARDKDSALAHLHESLENLQTDYLDLWQIHDVRTDEDVEQIFGKGGAIEAFREAKEKGLARFIGITGHYDPLVLKKCLGLFDFDTVMIPVNPAEHSNRPFIEEIYPVAAVKDMGVVGMKAYLRGAVEAPKKLLFCYSLTQPISTAVIGCDNVEQLKENAEIASNFTKLTLKEVQRVNQFFSTMARQVLYYKPWV